MLEITIKECNSERVFNKKSPLTSEQIQNFVTNEELQEKLKSLYCSQAFALYETLDNNYYLYDITNDALIKIMIEDYINLKKYGCFSNRVINEQHILDMINSLSSDCGVYISEGE